MKPRNVIVRLWGVAPFLSGDRFSGAGPIVRRGDALRIELANYGRTGREVLAVMLGDRLVGYVPDGLRHRMKGWMATHDVEVTAFTIGDRHCRVAMRWTKENHA
jgi:hypothetical protein